MAARNEESAVLWGHARPVHCDIMGPTCMDVYSKVPLIGLNGRV